MTGWQGTTAQCVKCGICEIVCPSRLSALRAIDLDRSHLKTDEVVNCTTCNRCVASCPAGVQVTKAIERMRSQMMPKGYGETLHNISTYGSSVVPDRAPGIKPKRCKTAYFAGCLTNYRQRQISDAVLYTLDRLGLEYTRIDEVCCGSPLNRMGRFDLAQKMLDENLSKLRALGVERVITSCPGCTSTFLEYQEEFEVFHYLEVYDELGIYDRLTCEDITATLQYPCHLYRNVSPYTMVIAEKLLKRLCHYIRLPDPDSCCGAGGGVRRNDLALSRDLKARKVADVNVIAPDIVAVACPQCLVQLSESFARVEDISVMVASNLGFKPTS
jgi:fumarate reductase (CoM/CoB) subunit B